MDVHFFIFLCITDVWYYPFTLIHLVSCWIVFVVFLDRSISVLCHTGPSVSSAKHWVQVRQTRGGWRCQPVSRTLASWLMAQIEMAAQTGTNGRRPVGQLTWQSKFFICRCISYCKWCFSIPILVYRRVDDYCPCFCRMGEPCFANFINRTTRFGLFGCCKYLLESPPILKSISLWQLVIFKNQISPKCIALRCHIMFPWPCSTIGFQGTRSNPILCRRHCLGHPTQQCEGFLWRRLCRDAGWSLGMYCTRRFGCIFGSKNLWHCRQHPWWDCLQHACYDLGWAIREEVWNPCRCSLPNLRTPPVCQWM